LKEKE